MKLNRFKQLLESILGDIRPIICEYEIAEDDIDLEKTYLSKDKITKQKEDNKLLNNKLLDKTKQPKVVDLTGKIFKDLETTTSEDSMRGLDFNEINEGFYKVNFSNEFIEKYFSLPSSQVYKTTSLYGDEHGDQPVPLVIKIGDKEYDIEDLLNDIHIETEGYPTNRTHFVKGVGLSLEGTGLGYLIYQQFIKMLGWGSSRSDASGKSQVVWSKLVKDPDFYSFVVSESSQNYVYVISKTNIINDPKDIVLSLLDNIYRNNSSIFDVSLGSELKRDFPEIEKLFSSPYEAVIKRNVEQLKLYINQIINMNDDSVRKINGSFYSSLVRYSYKLEDYFSNNLSLLGPTYNEFKELFDKFIKKFYNPSSVSTLDPILTWEINSQYKKYYDEVGTSKNWNGTSNYFNKIMDEISKFFNNYFRLIKYNFDLENTRKRINRN